MKAVNVRYRIVSYGVGAEKRFQTSMNQSIAPGPLMTNDWRRTLLTLINVSYVTVITAGIKHIVVIN